MRLMVMAAALLGLACNASAETLPDDGKIDKKMTTAKYVPGQTYVIHIPQGQTFAIALSQAETNPTAFGADKSILLARPTHNIVMLWSGDTPVKGRPMFIVSPLSDGTTRVYTLLVDTVPPAEAQRSLTFTYPAEEAALAAVAWKRRQAEKERKAAEEALARAGPRMETDTNQAYVLQGETREDWDLLPSQEVSDNGTDTHFRFPGNMRVPLIYVGRPGGKDAIADYTFDSATGIASVHQLAREFHLRGDNDALLCVFNVRYDPVGVRSPTGTVSPDVERVTIAK